MSEAELDEWVRTRLAAARKNFPAATTFPLPAGRPAWVPEVLAARLRAAGVRVDVHQYMGNRSLTIQPEDV